jgi:hypothetical protein
MFWYLIHLFVCREIGLQINCGMILGKVAYHIIGRMIFEEGISKAKHMILKANSFSSIDCWAWASFCKPWSNFGLFVPNTSRCQSFINDRQYSYFLNVRSYHWQDDI